jgi:hypothetical protein
MQCTEGSYITGVYPGLGMGRKPAVPPAVPPYLRAFLELLTVCNVGFLYYVGGWGDGLGASQV